MPLNAEKIRVGLFLAVLVGGVAVLLPITRGPSAYLVPAARCLLTGSFSANGVYPTTVFQDPRDAGEAAFGSWSGSGSHTGNFASAVFSAPEVLHLCVSGYPTQEGISLHLEDARDRRKLELKVHADPHETWKRFEWTLPVDWRNQSVRLVADDQAREPDWWLGVTLPRAGNAQTALPRLAHAAAYAGAMAAEGALFLLPGLVFAMLLQRRLPLDGLRLTAVAVTAAAAFGYLCFWIYFASVNGGKVASWVVLGASLVAAPLLAMQGWKRSAKLWRECVTCFALVLLTSWFYLGIGYIYKAGETPETQGANRVTMGRLPLDNMIPWVLAERIYHEGPLRPYMLGDWKSSDRPPLQAAIALAQYPLWNVFGTDTHYYLLAIFLQSLWVGALWIFLRFAEVPRRTVLIVLTLCTFSGFFFLNSFYVWPKLLAAALFLIGLTFTKFNRPDYQWTRFDATLAGSAIALGLLSHMGVLLAVPGLVWVLYRKRALPSSRMAAWGAASVVLLWLPWLIYQKWYDPPGDLLFKLHLAGSTDQGHSFGHLIRNAYGKLGAKEWMHNKLDNFRVLFLPHGFRQIFAHDPPHRYGMFMVGNFLSMFQALGLLNLGLLVRLRVRWSERGAATRPEIRLADRCLAAGLVSTFVWCLVMFTPGTSVVHQGSLATMLLLFLALGIYLSALAPRLAWVIPAVQALVIFPVFVFGKPLFENLTGTLMEGTIDPGFADVALLSLAGLLIWTGVAITPPAAGEAVAWDLASDPRSSASHQLSGPLGSSKERLRAAPPGAGRGRDARRRRPGR